MFRVGLSELRKLFSLEQVYRRLRRRRAELAAEALRTVGPLAPWWLQPAALDAAVASQPCIWAEQAKRLARQPHSDTGLVLVTCVWKELHSGDGGAERADGLLRPAAVLPVRWVAGEQERTGVPEPLVELARQVLRELDLEGTYSLDWSVASGMDIGLDASSLTLTPGSAFVPLAAGLVLFTDRFGGRPNSRIWSTGAWDGRLRAVCGLPQKVATMIQFAAEQIYVPFQNYEEAREQAERSGAGSNIIRQLPHASNLRQTISELLAQYRVAPARNAPIKDKAEHYLYLCCYHRPTAKSYKHKEVLADIIEQCRQRLQGELKELAESSPILIVSASHSPDAAVIAAGVFRPSRLVVLHTEEPEQDKALKATERLLRQFNMQYHPCRYAVQPAPEAGEYGPSGADDLVAAAIEKAKAVFRRYRATADRPVIVDLTPGTKLMTIGLMRAAPPPCRLVYLTHWVDPTTNEPRPGTERYVTVPHR